MCPFDIHRGNQSDFSYSNFAKFITLPLYFREIRFLVQIEAHLWTCMYLSVFSTTKIQVIFLKTYYRATSNIQLL